MNSKLSNRIRILFICILLVQVVTLTVFAAESLPDGLTGTDGTWNAENNTYSVTAIGTSGCNSSAGTATMKLTNSSGSAAVLSFTYTENTGEDDTPTYSVSSDVDETFAVASGKPKSHNMENGETITFTVTTAKGGYTSSIVLSDILFQPVQYIDIQLQTAANGSYTVIYTPKDGTEAVTETVTENKTVTVSNAVGATLAATPNSDYKFVGWRDATTGKLLSTETTYVEKTARTVKPEFISSSAVAAFQVENGGAHYYLNDALAEVGNSGRIIVVANATLPAGDYTIPSGVSLLIPYNPEYSATFGTTPATLSIDNYKGGYKDTLLTGTIYGSQHPYCTLTLGDNTTITCHGSINVNSAVAASTSTHSGIPVGAYGQINLASSSAKLILASANTTDSFTNNDTAGVMYCYGYIIGEGRVEVQSGANLYEMIQALGWRGGSMVKSWIDQATKTNPTIKSFMFADYAIQNVESDVLVEHGATCHIVFCMDSSATDPMCITSAYIGNGIGLFKMNSGSRVLRQYDEVNNRMKYTVAGSADFSSIDITVKFSGVQAFLASIYFGTDTISLNTAKHIFGMCSNMDLVVDSGATVNIPYAIKLLPNTSITINGAGTDFMGDEKGAGTLNVSGTLYLYDAADYLGKSYTLFRGKPVETIGAYYGHWDSIPVSFIATTLKSNFRGLEGAEFLTEIPPLDQQTDVASAQLIVNGALNVTGDGAIYTTANGGTSPDKVISGTGIFTHTGKSDTSILDEMNGWYDGNEFGVEPVQIKTASVIGLLAGISTDENDVNDSFSAGTYRGLIITNEDGTETNWWYQNYEVVEPTCIADGYTKYYCGDDESNFISVAGDPYTGIHTDSQVSGEKGYLRCDVCDTPLVRFAAVNASADSTTELSLKFLVHNDLVGKESVTFGGITYTLDTDGKFGTNEYIASTDTQGRYVYTVPVASGEMTKVMTVSFGDAPIILSDGTNTDSVSYTVAQYAQAVSEQSTDAQQKKLVDSLTIYGSYAQIFFSKEYPDIDGENLAYSGTLPKFEDITKIDAEIKRGTADIGIVLSESPQRAVLDAAISLKVYFTLDTSNENTIDNYTFNVKSVNGSKNVSAHQVGTTNEYYVDILNIPAAYLDEIYTITVTRNIDDVQYIVETSVLAYLSELLGKSTDEDEKNLAKAMYQYNQIADEFFKDRG